MPLLQALQALLPDPPKIHLAFGLWSATATLLLSLAVGVTLAGLLFLQALRLELGNPLKEAGARASGTRVRGLLVGRRPGGFGAGVALLRLSLPEGLATALSIPLGMEIQNRYLLECHPREVGRPYTDLLPLMPSLRERLQCLSAVQAVAMSCGGPLHGAGIMCGDCSLLLATHDLAALMAIPLREGRALEAGDEDQGRILVSEVVARKRWPGESPLGKRMSLLSKRELEVVGVMPGVRFNGPTEDPPPLVVEAVSSQGLGGNLRMNTFTVKATGSPQTVKAAIQAAARAELKDIPFTLNSLEEIRDEQLAQPRQLLLLSSLMGALALLLSLSGLYGLAAHLAESRRRELGIRVVLGAGPGRILATLARGSLLPVLPGLAAGSLLALGASRVLVHQAENFPALDSTLLLACSLLLAGAAALALLLPARARRAGCSCGSPAI